MISIVDNGTPQGQIGIYQTGHALSNTFWQSGNVSADERVQFFGQSAATVWLTGLSGAGKSTIAYELEKMLIDAGRACFVLDGDHVRQRLCSDLGFSPADRRENIRRVAEVARLMNEAGLLVITAFISPNRADRAMAQDIIGAGKFIEVHVSTSIDVCEARDPKGLYAKVRAGKIAEFTGISSPYEAPLEPALVLDTELLTPSNAATLLFVNLTAACVLPPEPPAVA